MGDNIAYIAIYVNAKMTSAKCGARRDGGRLPRENAAMKEVAIWTVLFAAVAVGAIAFEVRREVVPLWRHALAPLAAVACALSLPPEPRWLGAAIGAAVVGVVAGSVRGLSTALRVDHTWKLVRLRRVELDGLAVALAIAVLAGADIAPVVEFVAHRFTPPPFAAIAFLGAGYLVGRAVSIGVRSRSTPHDDMRPGAV